MLISVEMTRTVTQQVAAGYNYPAKTLSFQWHGMAVEETEYCCSFNHRGWKSSIVIRFYIKKESQGPNVGTVETTAEPRGSPADQRRQWSYGKDSTYRLQQTSETSAQDTEDTSCFTERTAESAWHRVNASRHVVSKRRCIYQGSCRTTVG